MLIAILFRIFFEKRIPILESYRISLLSPKRINKTMPGKITWSKIAKILREEYIEGLRCKICSEEIPEGENVLKTLNNIYKHFKEKHPEIIEQVKRRLASGESRISIGVAPITRFVENM